MQNLDKPEILCTCVSFIEMLGVDSENLRLHITAANYIQKELNISIGNFLRQTFDTYENYKYCSVYYLIHRKFIREHSIQKRR